MSQTVTIVFDRGELLVCVLVYVVTQFAIEWALQKRKGASDGD